MSTFLPDSYLDPSQNPSTLSAVQTPSVQVDDSDIALMQKILGAAAKRPQQIPETFMAYLEDWLQIVRLQIPIGQVVGYQRGAGIRGSLNADGTISAGTGFSSVHTSTGVYTITFDKAFSDTPVVLASPTTATARMVTTDNPSSSGVVLRVFDLTGTADDKPVNFWAFVSASF